MSLSIVHTRAALGVNAPPITVEVHISKGLPGLTMVGLPETTVKEHPAPNFGAYRCLSGAAAGVFSGAVLFEAVS